MPPTSNPVPRAWAASKLDWVVTDCLYRIATGVWPPRHRLPSLREAARFWSVNGLTCLRAYHRLIDLGVVRSRPRGGYFVAEDASVARLSRHQADFQQLYEMLQEQVRGRAGLSVLGAARAVAQLAEVRAAERPECAFVECTHFQAAGHAREVEARLRVPCASLMTAEIAGRRERIPDHVRTILTTHFHIGELSALADPPQLTVTAVPIEPAPSFLARLAASRATEVVVLALAAPLARSIARDLAARVGRRNARFRSRGMTIDKLDGFLRELLGEGPPSTKRLAILSTTLWSTAGQQWKDRLDVQPYIYEILESAWPEVADAIGMPLPLAQLAGPVGRPQAGEPQLRGMAPHS
jgi:DNA-binding transcriptional regulator YhcF (GntR family)